MFPASSAPSFGLHALIGLALTAAMIAITKYYTATEYCPVRKVAEGFARPAMAPS